MGGATMAAERLHADMMASTSILHWKDGKKAVFMLEFDDSASSAVKVVVPELKRRGLTGTFYINPGNGPFKSFKKQWETEIPGPGIEYANHTFTHVGATSVEQLDQELAKCSDEINKCYPDRKLPRLISFGKPGGVPWTVTRAETDEALKKYNLIERPPFIGYPIQIKSQEEMLAVVDKALATGEMEHLVFHGVGGDWLVTPFEMFTALLDKIEANRDQLWVTDPISWHKYVTERTGADVKTIQADKEHITIQLSCKADPVLYDIPLTLSTHVPADWKECQIAQSSTKTIAPVINGEVCYSALPGADEISIRPSSKR